MYTTTDGNEIKLYGRIWSSDGQYIANDLVAHFKKNKDAVVRLHTPGGSVFDGNLIYNALASTKSNVHLIIDGIAASMGSVFLASCKKVSIVDNGFVMVHGVKGTVDGGVGDMKKASSLMESMEKNFVKKFMQRTGKTEEEVRAWLVGDNWFDAEQALEAGLVDSIIDPVLPDLPIDASAEYNLVALSEHFEAYNFKATEKPVTFNIEDKMDIKKLSATSLGFLAVKEDASEADVNAAIKALHERAEKAENENKNLKETSDKEKTTRAEALVAKAMTEGKILAADKDKWTAKLVEDFDFNSAALEKIPGKGPGLNASATTEEKNVEASERKDWDLNKWRKEDPQGLLAMKTENPDGYKAIFKKAGINL